MRTPWMIIGVFLFLLTSSAVSATSYVSPGGYSNYGSYGGYGNYGSSYGYGSYGNTYSGFGQFYGNYGIDRYGRSYRYGYDTGYERYAPGTWASGQRAFDQWPGQWTGYSTNGLYGYKSNYGGSNYYAPRYYSPFTNSRFIPPWKYGQYYQY